MTSEDAHAPGADAWSSLPFVPRERRAPGGARYAPWWQRLTAFLIDVSAVYTAIVTFAIPVFVLAGLRNAEDGSPCGYGRAASRELLGRILIEGISFAFFALPWLLAYISAAWDGDRQTWHDRIGQTIVVRVERTVP